MTPGFATLLSSLGLVLVALPWVLGVQHRPPQDPQPMKRPRS
jgi:hypothetical protein